MPSETPEAERPAKADDAPLARPKPPDGKASLLRWVKRVLVALGLLAVAGVVTVILVIRHYERDLPPLSELERYDPPQVTRVLARDGTLLGELFTERRTVVRLDDVPAHVKLAVLAAEDASFYEHDGLDYLGMLRALYVNLRSSKARQGGSTITQQVVKNVLLTPERTYERKIREVLLARRIEEDLSKDQILALYLNHIYFGHSRYGIEEASRYYFGKSVRDVSLAEGAMLAGVVKGPGVYSPRIDPVRALERRALVLDQMVAKGFATAQQVEPAKAEPVTLASEDARGELAPEAVEDARRTLRAIVGPAAVRGGYTITTTIDPTLEAAARKAVQKNLDDFAKRHKLLAPLAIDKKRREPEPFEGTPKTTGHPVLRGVVTGADDARGSLTIRVGTIEGTVDLRDAARYNPKGLAASAFAPVGKVVRVSVLSPPVDDAPVAIELASDDEAPPPPRRSAKLALELGPQSALVAIDVRTREILALVGGYDAKRAGLDRTRSAHRQPGSTFKPFVFSYGIHARTLTAATMLETNPAAMRGYKPGNYDESEGAHPSRAREALAHSVNVAAVAALDRVGAANVVAWAHALGITSKLGSDLSLALGAYEVTPREMAAAYATFAAGGVYEAPILITRIVGPDGAEVPLPPRPPAHRVMDETEAYILTSLLQSVVDHGTGTRAAALKRPVAGKTGTSNKAKDAWFVGYTPDVACAVWTGYDDAAPLGPGEVGASAALPAFVDFMKSAHQKRPAAEFPVPVGLTYARIDPASGLLAYPDQADAIDEMFLPGTEPTEVATNEEAIEEDVYAELTNEASPDAGAPAAPEAPGHGEEPGVIDEPPPF